MDNEAPVTLQLDKRLQKYSPRTFEELAHRFKLTVTEIGNDVRLQHVFKKICDDQQYFSQLRATIAEQETEIIRLKRRVNGLLKGILGKDTNK